jgi:hypothetical protein
VIPASLFLAVLLLGTPSAATPFTAGAWWEYRELARERAGTIWSATESTTRFEVRRTRDGLFLHQSGGADPAPGPIERGEGWLRLTPWTGEEALPDPLTTGAAGPPAEDGLEPWRVEGEELVSVPAGDFRAFRCALRTSSLESVLWVVPDVGVVQEMHGVAGQPPELQRVLLRWSGGVTRPDSGRRPVP